MKQTSNVFIGDIRDISSTLPVVDCVITSPPYYKQRSYSIEGNSKEIGQEKTVSKYVNKLVSIFNKLNIAPWASIWVNIGDKRNDGGLHCVPEKFVIAMIEDGWCLIDKIVWAKEVAMIDGSALGTMMREPAKGRCNGNAWEYLFRFVRDPQLAWSDTSAILLPREGISGGPIYPNMTCQSDKHGRSIGNVWLVSGDRHKKGEQRRHSAVYPKALIERPIAMTCPLEITEKGPVIRDVRPTEYNDGKGLDRSWGKQDANTEMKELSGRMDTDRTYVARYPKDYGWIYDDKPVIRTGIVLDPFAGTGTTGEVALSLGRSFIGVELYQDMVDTMSSRVKGLI